MEVKQIKDHKKGSKTIKIRDIFSNQDIKIENSPNLHTPNIQVIKETPKVSKPQYVKSKINKNNIINTPSFIFNTSKSGHREIKDYTGI